MLEADAAAHGLESVATENVSYRVELLAASTVAAELAQERLRRLQKSMNEAIVVGSPIVRKGGVADWVSVATLTITAAKLLTEVLRHWRSRGRPFRRRKKGFVAAFEDILQQATNCVDYLASKVPASDEEPGIAQPR